MKVYFLNIVLAVILVIIILLQRSEGGALGLGVSQVISHPQGQGTLTKLTSIVATLFIICSIAIVAISRDEFRETQSVLEKQEEENPNLHKYLNLSTKTLSLR